jgi:ribonuclease HI
MNARVAAFGWVDVGTVVAATGCGSSGIGTSGHVSWRCIRAVSVGFWLEVWAPSRSWAAREEASSGKCIVSTSVAAGIRKRRISMSEVEIAVDGSCLGNPGPGWACILRYGEHERVLQGGVTQTTNNRMEMTAAVEALRALSRPCDVKVVTDSEYLRRGMTEFLGRWRSNGWKAASGNTIANQDLWEELDELSGYHRVARIHVRGHSGHVDQERCDALAAEAAREAKKESNNGSEAQAPLPY